MLFKKDSKVPKEIKRAKVESWYEGLDDRDRMILSRYSADYGGSEPFGFFMFIIGKAADDGNHKFVVKMCKDAYTVIDLSDYQMFQINEHLIQAYFMVDCYEDTKAACEANFDLYPSIKEQLLKDSGGIIPKTLYFRNRYIDVLVGIESAYDYANEMLVKYNEMGILSDEELQYRLNSLKTHRLQKLFDGVYTYRPKGE